jgi:hypothetical protein
VTSTPETPRRVAVIQSSVRWNFLWQRHQSLASAAADQGWEVYFIEPHPRRFIQLLRAGTRQLARRLRLVPGSVQAKNPIPTGVTVIPWRPWVSATRAVDRLCQKEPDTEVTLVLYLPSRLALNLVRVLGPSAVIYDRVLDWANVPPSWYPPRRWTEIEAELFSLAKLGALRVTSDSPAMIEDLARNGLQARLILPAVDHSFASHEWRQPPPDGPWGYFGTIREEEIDTDYLVEVATNHGLCVVGDVPTQVADRLRAAGARIHAPMTPDDLVRVIDDWSVVLLPYRPSPRSRTLVPAKTWNAIATRRPVVVRNLDLPHEVSRLMNRSPHGLHLTLQPTALLPEWNDQWGQLAAPDAKGS